MAHKPGSPSVPKPVPPPETQTCIGWATRRFAHNRLIYNPDDVVHLDYDAFKALLEAGAVTQDQPWSPPPVPVQPEPATQKPTPKGKVEKAAAGAKVDPSKLETHDLQARLESLTKS